MLDDSNASVSSECELVGAHVGTDAREADRQLRRLARTRAATDLEEARWLLIGRRAKVHELHGFVTFIEYMERVLDYTPRVAYERLRIAEALEELPLVRAALTAGEVSYSAVREVTRVAKAETEEAWVAATRNRTARQVQAMVRGRQPGERPADPADPELTPRALRVEVLPETFALFREAERQVRRELGCDVSDDDVIAWLCRMGLQPSAPADPEKPPVPPYQIALTVCTGCEQATQDGGGEAIDVAPAVVALARCDATEIGRVDGGVPTRATQTLTEARRLRVFRRDHGRCTVPGCRSTEFIHIHHLIEQEHGGGHEPSNLTLACAGHHRALHDGRLRITGEAPARLTFAHGDGRPWGAPPPPDLAADACSALRNLGYRATDAARAIATVHVGNQPTVQDLVRAALRELQPRSDR